MTSLLNPDRPPFFCPGCSHDLVVRALDKSFQQLRLTGERIAIVTDIGCSGLFDTFFNTHALHGLHGRALTYATGLKLACPALTVITIMGDGGLGIGGAHVLSSCRRNLDINLLVLNNFNYGMTGGQCSATTPIAAQTSSGFLGQLEAPLDICVVGAAAGATWVDRSSAADAGLTDRIYQAINHPGFSLMDITGVCPGQFSKLNEKPSKLISETTKQLAEIKHQSPDNSRPEYGSEYRQRCSIAKPAKALTKISVQESPSLSDPYSILFLGAAGQRINSGAEILCLSAMHSGMHVTQKNDYPITVLRGHSISEVILSPKPIHFTGIQQPDLIIALASEGISRRHKVFAEIGPDCLILKSTDVEIPETKGRVIEIDFKKLRIPSNQTALASLALLTKQLPIISKEMLQRGLHTRFESSRLEEAKKLISRCLAVQT